MEVEKPVRQLALQTCTLAEKRVSYSQILKPGVIHRQAHGSVRGQPAVQMGDSVDAKHTSALQLAPYKF